jgi:hypothetical protein
MLMAFFAVTMSAAQPTYTLGGGAFVDEHWFDITIDPEAYLSKLLTHQFDMGGVPRPADYETLRDAGFTITSTTRLGYTFFMMNNRVWPLGTPNGSPSDPDYEITRRFRKGLGRFVDKANIDDLYDPTMSTTDWWLPPGAAYWINPEAGGCYFDPGHYDDVYSEGVVETGSAYLNWAGYLPADGNDGRPLAVNNYADADAGAEWYCPYLRVDPTTNLVMDEFEYYAIGPAESPTGFEMATRITSWLHTGGVRLELVAGTWIGMVIRLINADLYDYQVMTGVGIVWGSPAPDILYDFTYSMNIPLWNFAGMNIPEMDYWGEKMMSTLDLAECRHAAFKIQEYLTYYEPYSPNLLWEMLIVSTPPYGDNPGMTGIVNFEGRGAHTSSNYWGKMLGRAGRYDMTTPRPDVEINLWGLGAYLDTLNPLMADTVPDSQVLTNIMGGFYNRNPYTLEYMWWGVESMPDIEEWIGPGMSYVYGGESGIDATYDNAYNGTHYACIGANEVAETPQGTYTPGPITPGGDDVVKPIGEGPYTCAGGTYGPYGGPYVEQSDLAGDDRLGMVNTWTIRKGIYWHDSDPGADGVYNTTDDGDVYPVTTADAEFGFNILKYQKNVRYMTQWQYVAGVEVVDTYTFKLFEERRFLFSFEGHDVCMLTPKHIWENYIHLTGAPAILDDYLDLICPCGELSSGDAWNYYSSRIDPPSTYDYRNHHDTWEGWEVDYMVDPTDPEGRSLTHLIGYGPFKYHLGGWRPEVYARFETNPTYFAGGPGSGGSSHICVGDTNFNLKCEVASKDLWDEMRSVGVYGLPNYLVHADIQDPAQVVELKEIITIIAEHPTGHSGHYWGPEEIPGFTRCPP